MSGQPLRARGGGGDGDVVVAIALHKFGLEEKRKVKEKNLSCCCQLKRVACVQAKSAQQVRACLCVRGDVVLGER